MKQQIQYIEFLRFAATLAVLCNHIPLVADHVFIDTASVTDHVFTNSLVHLAHWAVPIFVMITGALLLDKKREIGFEKAIKKYFWRMAAILLTVGTVYAMMERFTETHTVNLDLITSSIYNVLIGNTWKHMWYLYMLMGLYLVIPFIKPAINHLSLKSVDSMLAILFLFACLFPTINNFTGFSCGVMYPMGSIYIFYLILGWRLTQLTGDSWLIKNVRLSCILIAVLSVFLLFCCYMIFAKGLTYMEFWEDYSSPIEVALGVLIFSAAFAYQDRFGRFTQMGGVKLINRDSFGIYVFHMLWVNVVYKVVKFNPLEYNYLVFIPLFLLIVGLSIATTEVFRKIPVLGKYI